MNNVTLRNTTEKEAQLYQRLTDNDDRSIVDVILREKVGINGASTKTTELLSFIVGKYRNRIYDGMESQRVFKDVYETEVPVEVAKVITISKGNHKTLEVRWIIDPATITDEWHTSFDIDSTPLVKTADVRKKTQAEKLGMTDSELGKHKLMSKLDDLMETNPNAFEKLINMLDSL